MKTKSMFLVFSLLLSLTATAGNYGDLSQVLKNNEYPVTYSAFKSMEKEFDNLCGDIWCEGEYSNIVSMGIECSVDLDAKTLGQCVWTFAGVETSIDEKTGRFSAEKKFFSCDLNITGSVADLLSYAGKVNAASNHYGILEIVAPGAPKSVYETINDCLSY